MKPLSPRPGARARRAFALVAGFALVVVVLTSPLAFRADRVGPINTGDGQLSLWNVAWVARALVLDPLHVYDANIFAPRTGTLAYSEANLVAGALAMPGWWLTRNPYLAHNSAILLAFLLTALAMFALARRLTGSGPAALVAAIGFTFAPIVCVRYAHVQLLMTMGLPVTMLAFHRFVERRSAGRIAGLSAALVLAALCSGYYGIFAGLAVGLGFAFYGITRRLWRNPRDVAAAAAVVVIAGLLVLPFFLPYLQLERGGEAFRSLDESRRYSADWRSYLTSTAHVQRRLLTWVVPFDRAAFPERVLFPGFVASALAGIALVLAWRGRDAVAAGVAAGVSDGEVAAGVPARLSESETAAGVPARRSERGAGVPARPSGSTPSAATPLHPQVREAIGFYALLAAVSAWLSFGPSAGLYWLAYRFVPGFTLTRAPARFGFLVVFAIAVLASLGCALLLRGRRRTVLAAGLIAALAGVELATIPLDVREAMPMPSPYRVLAGLPRGAVVELPYFFLERDLYRNSLYMLYSTAHWQPLVNGYSDFIPPDYRPTIVPISTFPSREAFRLLRERGARYAVFHLNLYNRRSREKVLDAIGRYADYLRPLAAADDVLLYEVVAWPR